MDAGDDRCVVVIVVAVLIRLAFDMSAQSAEGFGCVIGWKALGERSKQAPAAECDLGTSESLPHPFCSDEREPRCCVDLGVGQEVGVSGEHEQANSTLPRCCCHEVASRRKHRRSADRLRELV